MRPLLVVLVSLILFFSLVCALRGKVEDYRFHSTVYNNTAHILFYTPPSLRCVLSFGMPVTVFLSGLYVDVTDPNDITSKQVIEAFDTSIYTRQSKCSLLVVPKFELGPFGGYWYYNNPSSLPVDFLKLEVVREIKRYYGLRVTKNTDKWSLLGHSMGGFGSLRIGMTQDEKYFGVIAGLNSASLVWDNPVGYTPIIGAIKYEQDIYSQFFDPSTGCNYNTSTGYLFYADKVNTPATYGVNSFCHALFYDYQQARKDTPRISSTPSSDCKDYIQYPYYQFVVDQKGNINQDIVYNLTPDRSPLRYVTTHAPLLKWASKRIFLSLALQDFQVDPASIRYFSSTLSQLGIKHTLFEYQGRHEDLTLPTLEYLQWFSKII